MKHLTILSAAACFGLLGAPRALDGGQPLSLHVTPLMAAAPAFISVRAVVEASEDNRALEIVAQSSDFFRSSRIDLDGRDAPPLSVFQYPNLPPGLYEVSAHFPSGPTASGRRSPASSRWCREAGPDRELLC